MPALVGSRRPLTDAERRVLQAKVLASDAPWTVVTVLWLVVGALPR